MLNKKTVLSLIGIFIILRLALMAFVPLTDASESRYANLAANMTKTGDFLAPQLRMDDEMKVFKGKPALFFQMGGVSCEIFGINEFAVRLPAMISAIAILLFLYFTLRTLVNETTALAGITMCFFSAFFYVFSGVNLTDILLAFSISGAIFAYMLFCREEDKPRKKWYSRLFFVMLGIGMLAKGPLVLVMTGMPIFLFTLFGKRWKELRDHAWFSGIALFLLIAAPWYIMMSQRIPGFLEYFFINENIKRFLFKEYGDEYGAGREFFRGVSFVWFMVVNAPFWLLLLLGIKGKKWGGKENFTTDIGALPLLSILCMVGFLAGTSRVLIYYLLPSVPLCMALLAIKLHQWGHLEKTVWQKTIVITAAGIGSAVIISLSVFGSFPEIFTQKSYKGLYAELTQKSAELYPHTKFYFSRSTPYSAEFYLDADQVVHHPEETHLNSWINSSDCILIIKKSDFKRMGMPEENSGRELLFETRHVKVFSPVLKQEI